MIRKFNKNDIDIVMQIWKNENIKAHNFIEEEYWQNNYEYVRNLLPNSEIYVYTNQNIIEGFIRINNNYIEGIFVKSDSQNKGIGTALLNKAKEIKTNLTLSVYEKIKKQLNFIKKMDLPLLKRI